MKNSTELTPACTCEKMENGPFLFCQILQNLVKCRETKITDLKKNAVVFNSVARKHKSLLSTKC